MCRLTARHKRPCRYWLPWLVGMPAETTQSICSFIFGGIFERHPSLRVAFAHGGGSFLATLGRIEHGFNVRPDLCQVACKVNPRHFLGKFWIDSWVADPEMLEFARKKIGADKIMLGSDYPFPLGETTPGQLVRTGSFTEEERGLMLGQSCLRWLNLPEHLYPKAAPYSVAPGDECAMFPSHIENL
jgi:aminocarboxymuconate-semialdehyde decarboxylase